MNRIKLVLNQMDKIYKPQRQFFMKLYTSIINSVHFKRNLCIVYLVKSRGKKYKQPFGFQLIWSYLLRIFTVFTKPVFRLNFCSETLVKRHIRS